MAESKINWEALRNSEFCHSGQELDTVFDAVSTAFHFCGCGTDDPAKLLYTALKHFSLEHDERPKTTSYGYDNVAWELAAKILDVYELTEHGGSVFGSWLNPEGQELWELLKQWPEPEGE